MPENVTYGKGYLKFIRSKTQAVLTESEVQEIIKIIENGRLIPYFKTNREHVKHVKEIVAEKQSNKLCPKCGNSMVKRVVKKGRDKGRPFWGCSNFPKCKGITSL